MTTAKVKIDAYIKDGEFHTGNHSIDIEKMEYSYTEIVDWCLGMLVLGIGKNDVRNTLVTVMWIMHMWLLYAAFVKQQDI